MKANQTDSFSRGKRRGFASIAGGEFSTNELYPDARTAAPGNPAQDTLGDAERLIIGSPDRLWPGASLQFSA